MNEQKFRQATLCVHRGTKADVNSDGVNTPITTSTAFGYDDGVIYPRYFNTPNQKSVVDKLCALEQGEAGLVLSSGMAAISTALLATLGTGDHVVVQSSIYGGTRHFIVSQCERLGIDYSFAETAEVDAFARALQPSTKVLYLETPSNPLLEIVDIVGIVELAKARGLTTIVDGTFATPINQKPLTLGVDIVVHSGTKYLSGHSDICFGALVTSDTWRDAMFEVAMNFGASLNAATCALIERSLKTLSLRVERQSATALSIAGRLQQMPEVDRVLYPGLHSHPGHAVAAQQMSGFGGMLSFVVKGQARDFVDRLRLIKEAVSLGGLESTICIPAYTSHAKLSRRERLAIGVCDDMLRLSVGIEDCEDILNDIRFALDKAPSLAAEPKPDRLDPMPPPPAAQVPTRSTAL